MQLAAAHAEALRMMIAAAHIKLWPHLCIGLGICVAEGLTAAWRIHTSTAGLAGQDYHYAPQLHHGDVVVWDIQGETDLAGIRRIG